MAVFVTWRVKNEKGASLQYGVAEKLFRGSLSGVSVEELVARYVAEELRRRNVILRDLLDGLESLLSEREKTPSEESRKKLSEKIVIAEEMVRSELGARREIVIR
jgi:hypothetical protein